MLKSSEHKKLWCYTNCGPPNLKDWFEVRSADPPIWMYYFPLRIGSPVCIHVKIIICQGSGYKGFTVDENIIATIKIRNDIGLFFYYSTLSYHS